MWSVQAAFAVSCLLLGVVSAVDNCSTLNVGRAQSSLVDGTSLTVCATTDAQCCTQEFLDSVRNQASRDLVQGLKDQVHSGVVFLEDIEDTFSSYFEGGFITTLEEVFPGSSLLSDSLDSIVSELITLLGRENFAITAESPEVNTTQIFTGIVTRIKGAIRQLPFPFTDSTKECLVMELDKHINGSGILLLGRSLEKVRRSVTAITRIVEFLLNFEEDLDGFVADTLPSQCVTRLVEISFCGRCTQNVPPLCRNSCGALARGCYAGFLAGLQSEFDLMWTVLMRLVREIENGVGEMFETVANLFDVDFTTITATCANPFGKRKRRDVPAAIEMLVSGIIEDITDVLDGDIYGGSTPVLCLEGEEDMARETTFCNGPSETRVDWVCESRDVCTRSCQCWDGQQIRSSDIDEFTGVGIEDQANNPVISIPEEENMQIMQGRSPVVTAFLRSDEFTQILPEGLTIFGSDSTTDGTSDGAADGSLPSVSVSAVLVTSTTLLALFCANNF